MTSARSPATIRMAAAFAWACVALGGLSHADAAQWAASVDEPRAFAHTIGDVLTQRILLEAGGRDVGDVAGPSAGRADLWLERRPARIETDAEGQRWMVIDYQLTNVPRTLTQIALPALALTTRSGDVLSVSAWPVSIGPLAPDDAPGAGALRAIQPDRLAPPAALAPIRRRLGATLALLAATLLAWAGWWFWRNRREAARLPFARAWRQMRRLGPQEGHADAAWHVVHRAMNETAGRVVYTASLATLIERKPWLQPLRPQLEQFYRQSEAHFFEPAPDNKTGAYAHAPASLVALCHALYRAERHQQR